MRAVCELQRSPVGTNFIELFLPTLINTGVDQSRSTAPNRSKNMKIIVIRHYGIPFRNNANAVLIATGLFHHIILLK